MKEGGEEEEEEEEDRLPQKTVQLSKTSELKDKADIQETILKYATGIDTCDWALYRSIFAD